MTYDPFLDPPRPGCRAEILSGAASASAVTLVVGAGVRWGIGDAIAVAFWLAFFAGLAWLYVDQRARDRRLEEAVRAHPTSRLRELPETRSHVRIVTSPREGPSS